MHINMLDIKGFGKLNGRSLQLINGLNVIYGDNEAGKSTLLWFIKGMFYGLRSGRKSLNAPPPPAKRFEPWDGGPYGGTMIYTLDNGNVFRVERDFKNGNVRLFDSSYNDISGSFEIGRDKLPMFAEKHLCVDEEVFDRTVLIKQAEVRIDTAGTAVLADRIANLISTGSEDISFQRADKALAEAIKSSVGTDRTRTQPLDKLQGRLRQLEEERARIEEKRKHYNSVREELLSAQRKQDMLEACEKYLEDIGRLIEIRKKLDANLKREAELKEIIKYLKEENEKEEKDKEKVKGDLQPPAGNRMAALIFCFIVAAVFAIMLRFAVAAGGYGNSEILTLISVIGLISFGITGLILFKNWKKSGFQTDIPEKNDTNPKFAMQVHTGDDRVKDRESVYLELGEISIKLKELSDELDRGIERAAKFKCSIDGMFKQDKIDAILYDLDADDLETAWKTELNKTRRELIDTSLKVKYCEGLLKNDEESGDLLQRIEEETIAVKEKIDYLKNKGDALKLAREVLTEAALELKRVYAPSLDKRMSEVIAGITGGRYTDLRGNDRMFLNAAVPENGEIKDILSLSGATVDQMYLALRLAVADMLTSQGESLPLFMDEVFAQFDDKRTEQVLKYLQTNYLDRQILLFTCKRREVELARAVYGEKMSLVEL